VIVKERIEGTMKTFPENEFSMMKKVRYEQEIQNSHYRIDTEYDILIQCCFKVSSDSMLIT
jgi:hypothetical protein